MVFRALSASMALVLTTGAAVGCAKLHARVPPPPATLETPPPPPRVTVPVDLPEPEEPAPAPPPAPVTPPAAPRRDPSTSRPASPPPAPATPPAPSTENPAVLQTAPDVEAQEQRTRAKLEAAQRDRDKVLPRYRDLTPGAREHFDTAAGYIRMAEAHLKLKNFAYADLLADRAAPLLGMLLKSLSSPTLP